MGAELGFEECAAGRATARWPSGVSGEGKTGAGLTASPVQTAVNYREGDGEPQQMSHECQQGGGWLEHWLEKG